MPSKINLDDNKYFIAASKYKAIINRCMLFYNIILISYNIFYFKIKCKNNTKIRFI